MTKHRVEGAVAGIVILLMAFGATQMVPGLLAQFGYEVVHEHPPQRPPRDYEAEIRGEFAVVNYQPTGQYTGTIRMRRDFCKSGEKSEDGMVRRYECDATPEPEEEEE